METVFCIRVFIRFWTRALTYLSNADRVEEEQHSRCDVANAGDIELQEIMENAVGSMGT